MCGEKMKEMKKMKTMKGILKNVMWLKIGLLF
jgi:hypothetical protein